MEINRKCDRYISVCSYDVGVEYWMVFDRETSVIVSGKYLNKYVAITECDRFNGMVKGVGYE